MGLTRSVDPTARPTEAEMHRMVNRNDGIIHATVINGRVAFRHDTPAHDLGQATHYGRFLRRPTPFPH